jgi:alanine-glyoxylate transaminase / (R)-3-amino-2-methylpropionate-pyruvate transaminase
LAPGYLPAAYDSVKKAGGLCIADEVQSGFARTGSHFWGFESHGVQPDIVTMAKVITSYSLLVRVERIHLHLI